MTPKRISRFLLAACFTVTMTGGAMAQLTKPFEPYSGQPGKDVVWVPSPQALVDRMLDMAKVTPKDNLVDLGSGDGRTVITAAKRGIKAMGVEFNPDMVALSRQNAIAAGVTDKATFIQGDIFETDFSKADVVTMFLLSSLNLRLRPTLLNMRPGTRVVSNTFDMAEWEPDQRISAGGDCSSFCSAMLWIIPAKVGGAWKMGKNELTLSQEFQMLTGSVNTAPISNGKMHGAEISFTAGGKMYTGRVNGNRMEGSASDGTKWQAIRS
ncbi:MAG: class I SAM-dependent methyltransferase [Pseudomonadota bacterium]